MTEVCECNSIGANGMVSSCPAYDGITANAICESSNFTTQELLFLTENVTSEQIGYVFAWGVAAVLVLWSLGYGVSVVKRLINLA